VNDNTLESIAEKEERAGLERLFDLGVELPIPPEMTRKIAGYIAQLEAEVVTLRAQIKRLSAPVSHDEIIAHQLRVSQAQSQRKSLDVLIASRKGEEAGNG
jgi:hypothetical protein